MAEVSRFGLPGREVGAPGQLTNFALHAMH